MPASRRAKARTFAPRSWPSRPGLATSTRMGRSRSAIRHISPFHPVSEGYGVLRRNVTPALEACQRYSLGGTGLTFQMGVRIFARTTPRHAEVAELVDAPDSGSGPG